MTRYAFGQLTFAVVVTVVGAIKAYQILVNTIADAAADWTGVR